MEKIKAIIFDLDGTLYGLDDTVGIYYAMEVEFMKGYLHKTENEVKAFLQENGVLPYRSEKAQSATDLFLRIGVPKSEWVTYREANFDVSGIDEEKAASAETVAGFSEIAPIYLLSSNTYGNIARILGKIGIEPALFERVICSDRSPCKGLFTKKEVMESLCRELGFAPSALFSIGDRYHTDVEPLLELGGAGVVVKTPHSLSALLCDLKNGALQTCDAYTFYKK